MPIALKPTAILNGNGRAQQVLTGGFVDSDARPSLVLMFAALSAVVFANSSLATSYESLLSILVTITVGDFAIAKPLLLWINDGLMAVFFFLVGLEIKRELVQGELSTWPTASLPAVTALGGMLLPTIIYLAVNASDPDAARGWAIPAATDIAFALGVLALLGSRVPVGQSAVPSQCTIQERRNRRRRPAGAGADIADTL